MIIEKGEVLYEDGVIIGTRNHCVILNEKTKEMYEKKVIKWRPDYQMSEDAGDFYIENSKRNIVLKSNTVEHLPKINVYEVMREARKK